MSNKQKQTCWFRFKMTNAEIAAGKYFELMEQVEDIFQDASFPKTAPYFLYFHKNLNDSYTSFFLNLTFEDRQTASHIIADFKAESCLQPDLKYLVPIS